jgi:hypothetical protein
MAYSLNQITDESLNSPDIMNEFMTFLAERDPKIAELLQNQNSQQPNTTLGDTYEQNLQNSSTFLSGAMDTNISLDMGLENRSYTPSPLNVYVPQNNVDLPSPNEKGNTEPSLSLLSQLLNENEDKEKERLHKRAVQNRYASRNYRQRKKLYVENLEKEVARLQSENQQLYQQLQQANNESLLAMQQLQLENQHLQTELQQVRSSTAQKRKDKQILEESQSELLYTLDQQVKSGADDSQIMDVIDKVHTNCKKQHHISPEEVTELLSPNFMMKLTLLDTIVPGPNVFGVKVPTSTTYTPNVNIASNHSSPLNGTSSPAQTPTTNSSELGDSSEPPVQDMKDVANGLGRQLSEDEEEVMYWVELGNEIGLSDEQLSTFLAIRQRHQRRMQTLYVERQRLTQQLRTFFSQKLHYFISMRLNPKKTSADFPDVLQASENLQFLKKNLLEEQEIVCATMHEIRTLMSPTQEALFLLHAHRQEASSWKMLNAIWNATANTQQK